MRDLVFWVINDLGNKRENMVLYVSRKLSKKTAPQNGAVFKTRITLI